MKNLQKFYINGEWVDPQSKKTMPVFNPATEEPFAVISLGSKEDTNLAVSAAKVAFETWKDSSKELIVSSYYKELKRLQKIVLKILLKQ